MSTKPGVLYVVATPIGNLDDLSPRAVRVLSDVEYIAAEDTRHSRRLLQHFGIRKPLLSFHEHNEDSRIPRLVADLQAGHSIALVCDAGTPLINDPGFQLLRALRQQGIPAVPIPGPSSLLAALSVAGLPTDRFFFEGFLPAKASARRRRLEALKRYPHTLIFFESSHRIRDSLADMAAVFERARLAVVARELTKLFEEIHGGTLAELGQWLAQDQKHCQGEFVILIHGAPEQDDQIADQELRRLLSILLEELPLKRAVAVAEKITQLKKNSLYELALKISGS